MSVKIQIRRGTAAEWASANPTLAAGELGYDTTNDILKVGDGTTAWSGLADADNQTALQTTYSDAGQTYALGANVQAAIHAVDDELLALDGRLDTAETDIDAVEGRLDTIEGDANTAGSIAKAEADAKAYADAQIDAAKLALGTNFSVADIAGRDALTGLTVGDLIFVTDDGDGKWAQYKVTVADPIAYEKIMDEDIYLNAISASAVKTAYESNADTNAFTDALLSKLNAIEAGAKDDQDADEVPYDATGQTYALGADVQAAIYAIDDELIAQDGRLDTAESDITAVEGRLDTIEGDDQTAGSIAKALKDAKDYADQQDALQDNAVEIAYTDTDQTYALGANVQDAIYAIDNELIAQDGRLDIIEGGVLTSGSIAYAAEAAVNTSKTYTDNQIILAKTALGTNFVVADIAARDALTDLTVGDNVFVEDVGNTRWAQYKVVDVDPVVFTKIMDQSILINAIDGPGIKAAYEANADTNAFTDALLTKLNGIEDNAKDDQNAAEVDYDNSNTTLSATSVQAALDEIHLDVFASNTANFVLAAPAVGDGAPSYRALVAADIPNLDADKINSGTLGVERIPNLSADKINADTFSVDRIPGLDVAKIITGTFDVSFIPNLNADKINAGTLSVDRIPNLSATKITEGALDAARIPTLEQSKVTNLTTDLAAKVAGPASATDLNFAAFDGTTGKLVADSGFSASSFAKITIGSVEPTSPAAGDLWFNNDAAVKNLFFYDGTDWIGVNTYQ